MEKNNDELFDDQGKYLPESILEIQTLEAQNET